MTSTTGTTTRKPRITARQRALQADQDKRNLAAVPDATPAPAPAKPARAANCPVCNHKFSAPRPLHEDPKASLCHSASACAKRAAANAAK